MIFTLCFDKRIGRYRVRTIVTRVRKVNIFQGLMNRLYSDDMPDKRRDMQMPLQILYRLQNFCQPVIHRLVHSIYGLLGKFAYPLSEGLVNACVAGTAKKTKAKTKSNPITLFSVLLFIVFRIYLRPY